MVTFNPGNKNSRWHKLRRHRFNNGPYSFKHTDWSSFPSGVKTLLAIMEVIIATVAAITHIARTFYGYWWWPGVISANETAVNNEISSIEFKKGSFVRFLFLFFLSEVDSVSGCAFTSLELWRHSALLVSTQIILSCLYSSFLPLHVFCCKKERKKRRKQETSSLD